MKITILTQYFPPETGAPQNRLWDLSRRLAAFGHDVQVLTALPSYPGDSVYPEYEGKENTIETVDGVRIARVGLYVPKKRTFARRMANYLTFAWNARWHGARLMERSDILMIESPPLFLALGGVPLARKLGAKLVVNVSDLWPQSAVALGIVGQGPALRASYALEGWMYRSADLVTGQTEGIVDDIRARFPRKRVELFPNGVDVASYAGPFDRGAVRKRFGWGDDDFVIGYTGLFGHAQALDQILGAAAILRDEPRIRFAMFGDGPTREQLQRRVDSEKLDTVTIHPRVDSRQIPEIQAAFDAGVVPLASAPLFEGARPSKMFELMAAARPLLLCARGEAVRVMEGAPGGSAGVAVDPERPLDLADAVRRLSADRQACEAMGSRGRLYMAERFDREAIARNVERLFGEIVAARDESRRVGVRA